MDDKSKKLAANLSELIPEHETLQDTYDSLRLLMKKQKDYFSNFKPETIIKVLFYIWSFKKTGNFDLGDKLLNKIYFARLITSEGNVHTEECDNCSGNAQVHCEDCYGNGTIECDECSGDGSINCEECNGSGQIDVDGEMENCADCNGDGEFTCNKCAGHGTVNCENCDSGYIDCEECDATGEVRTDAWEYNNYFIVTWNDYIKDRCEITEGIPEISFSEYDFDRLRDEYIILSGEEEFTEFEDFIEENEMYCLSIDDNPRLDLVKNSMEITSYDYSLKPFEKNT